MASNTEDTEWPSIPRWVIVVTLLALLCLPFALIGLNILERSLFDTAYVANAYRTIGIHDSLQSLYTLIAPWFNK